MSNGDDDMRADYSDEFIKSGVRGKYAERYQEGTNVVLIDRDLQEFFPDSESVNKALREYLETKRKSAT